MAPAIQLKAATTAPAIRLKAATTAPAIRLKAAYGLRRHTAQDSILEPAYAQSRDHGSLSTPCSAHCDVHPSPQPSPHPPYLPLARRPLVPRRAAGPVQCRASHATARCARLAQHAGNPRAEPRRSVTGPVTVSQRAGGTAMMTCEVLENIRYASYLLPFVMGGHHRLRAK
jgi:hypothetical protein